MDRRAQMTVLFSHANAEDVSMVFAWLRELSLRLGVNVPLLYTGYARSSKPPSELDVHADVDAAWDYLMDRKVDARRVVLYSRSVGSGPTLYLAERLGGGHAARRRRPPVAHPLGVPHRLRLSVHAAGRPLPERG